MAQQHPIFVLSLAESLERRRSIAERLDALGLTFTFFDAIDGRVGLSAEQETLIDRDGPATTIGRDMSDAEFACALSHQAIYTKIIEDGVPLAIILEDDAVPDPKLADVAHSPDLANAPLALFCHRVTRVFLRRPCPLSPGVTAYPLATSATFACAYSITAEAAAKMLALSFPITRPADWPFDISRIGAMAVHPQIAFHPIEDVTTSTIGGCRKLEAKGLGRMVTAGYWRRTIRKKFATRIA